MESSWRNHVLEDYAPLRGRRVIVRVDWNMPTKEGKILDTSRADVTFEFLRRLSFAGAKTIIMTHFGEQGESLSPMIPYITQHMPFMHFIPSLDFEELERESRNLSEGSALLIENVRMWKGEEENLPSLAKSFARLGDVYINNAFSVSHREHASVVGIPSILLPYLGPLMVRELEHLEEALIPKRPALLIVGGAKIKTKLGLIKRYLDQGVRVFVGGAMAHDIWKARGVEIGTSLYDGTTPMTEQFLAHPLLITPRDVITDTGETVPYDRVPKDRMIVDCGKETVAMLAPLIEECHTVIMNGPLGLYEKGWMKGSEDILSTVATSHALTYIGGGDTVGIAHTLHLLKKFTFVSLGGGAMLDYLASGTLPGIHAVTEWKQAGYR